MTCPVSLCGSLCTLFCVISLSVPGLVRSPRVHPQPCCGEWGGCSDAKDWGAGPSVGVSFCKSSLGSGQVWGSVMGSGKGVSLPHTVCSLGTGENQGSVGRWVLP